MLGGFGNVRTPFAVLLGLIAAGCSGPQSALDPAGREAEWIAGLFAWMAAGAVAVWIGMIALGLYAPRAHAPQSTRGAHALIVGGGVALPALVVSVLIVFGLGGLPRMLHRAPDGVMWLEVTGAQWWWRVRYFVPGRAPIELANEIRLPVGQRVNLRLTSTDVVHSLWMPSIAGKLDMIPGRVNTLPVEPTRIGTYRGACAEFCGESHAKMNFAIVVMPQDEFDAWLNAQARPAAPPGDPRSQRGEDAFFRHGCSTCHTVRGTRGAAGAVAPDLTHVASRHTIAAGQLPTGGEHFQRWIRATELVKPGVHMPAFANLPDGTLEALAAYLAQLQ